jgi:hypothetical protein
MTPWDWKNVLGVWEIRYGLNQFFVQKHIKYGDLDKLTFMAWDGK